MTFKDTEEENNSDPTLVDGEPLDLETEEEAHDSDLKTEAENPTILNSEEGDFKLPGNLMISDMPPPPTKSASLFRLSVKIAADEDKDGDDLLQFRQESVREGLDGFDPESEELVAIITVGVSASGKSTWARKFAELHPNFVEINRDNMRELFWDDRYPGTPFSFKQWNFREWEPSISKMVDLAIKDAAQNKQSIIISDTNLTDKFRNEMMSKLESLGYKVITKDFDIELDEALKRNEGRGSTVGADIIRRQFEQYKSYKDSKKTAASRIKLTKAAKSKIPLFKK
jgi:predicted kinase